MLTAEENFAYPVDRIVDVCENKNLNSVSSLNEKDVELWKKFKSGNRSAFVYIYNTYFNDLYAYANHFSSDVDLIKDAIQDLFVRLNESRQQLSDTNCIKFYLYKCIKREVLQAEKRKMNLFKHLARIEKENFQFESSEEDRILSDSHDQELAQSLRNAANSLSHRQREIIFYHFFEGFSVQQIQELMGFSSVRAVYNLLNKSLKHLKQIISAAMLALLFLIYL